MKVNDLLSLSFYDKSAYTGSDGDMCFKIEKKNEDEKRRLLASVWKGPYSSDNTPDEKKAFKEFDFSQEGIEKTYEWLMEESRVINR